DLFRTREQDVVELRARDLIRQRPRDFGDVGEIDAATRFTVVREQTCAPLRRKIGSFHLVGDAERRKRIVRCRQQRFADVKTRKRVALEQHDFVATLRERDCSRRAGGTAAGDGEIEVVSCHYCWTSASGSCCSGLKSGRIAVAEGIPRRGAGGSS